VAADAKQAAGGGIEEIAGLLHEALAAVDHLNVDNDQKERRGQYDDDGRTCDEGGNYGDH